MACLAEPAFEAAGMAAIQHDSRASASGSPFSACVWPFRRQIPTGWGGNLLGPSDHLR